MKPASKFSFGALLIGLAALLWATDAVIRYPLVHRGIDPVLIVFFDHCLGVALLTPYLFFRYGRKALRIKPAQWTALFVVGGGGSALATVLFTASFQYVNPSVSILLQKLQPILVVFLAMLFLGERPHRGFYLWAGIALISGIAISFPDFNFSFLGGPTLESRGSLYALAAAALWGLSTVVGKGVVGKLPPLVVTYWRFVFGLVTLAGILLFSQTPLALPTGSGLLSDPFVLRSFLYLALVPGLTALILYYQGMRRTPATTTTFMELLFPVGAVAMNTIYLKIPLLPGQAVAAFILLFSVTRISLSGRR